MIKSLSFDQSEILSSILSLIGHERFDADLSYGNGGFYGKIPEPPYRFDIDPQKDGVVKASSCSLPIPSGMLKSAIFDPPFLTYVRSARTGNGSMVMAKRFGGYWRYEELEEHYRSTIKEAFRILSQKGIFVFKCQDIVHNHRLQATHCNVIRWAEGMFRLRDLFILAAKHRMPIPQQTGTAEKRQKHARIHHSYFLVMEKI